MGTNTRPELSEKNKWWISKHRYYELRHFCLQYPEWKEILKSIDGLPDRSAIAYEHVDEGKVSDPTPTYAETFIFYNWRVDTVEKAAHKACDHQFWYIVLVDAVTTGSSYGVLLGKYGIMPVSRDEWYIIYRKFFWLLDKMRG